MPGCELDVCLFLGAPKRAPAQMSKVGVDSMAGHSPKGEARVEGRQTCVFSSYKCQTPL